MVTEAEYEKWSRKTKKSLEFDRVIEAYDRNQKYKDELVNFSYIYGNINVFEDLEKLQVDQVESHISELAKLVNECNQSDGSAIGLNKILYSHSLSYEALKKLFLKLTGHPNEYSRVREEVANDLIKKLTKSQNDFIEIFHSPKVPLIDRPVLILGLPIVTD